LATERYINVKVNLVDEMFEYLSSGEISLIEETEKEALSIPISILKEKIEKHEMYVKHLPMSSRISYYEGLKLTLMKEIYRRRNKEQL
jgi:hypothetical protein